MFKFLQRPENRDKLKRFAVAMQGTAASDPLEMILQGRIPSVWFDVEIECT
jgi:hypothetical protein